LFYGDPLFAESPEKPKHSFLADIGRFFAVAQHAKGQAIDNRIAIQAYLPELVFTILRLDRFAGIVSHMVKRMRSKKMAWQSFFFIMPWGLIKSEALPLSFALTCSFLFPTPCALHLAPSPPFLQRLILL
jgi:hypothetical protein